MTVGLILDGRVVAHGGAGAGATDHGRILPAHPRCRSTAMEGGVARASPVLASGRRRVHGLQVVAVEGDPLRRCSSILGAVTPVEVGGTPDQLAFRGRRHWSERGW